jgi:ankyrin repeat protein
MASANMGHPDIAKALLRAGADVSATSTLGETASSLASFRGHQDIAQLLSTPAGGSPR